MNNSTFPPDLTTNYQYVTVGSIAILTNSLIFFTMLRNHKLLQNSAFVCGLALGDFFDSLALLGNGFTRIYRVAYNIPDMQVHPSYCMTVYGFTAVFVMGNQIPGAMFFLIGLERFLAVRYFDWYYVKWCNRLAWLYTLGAYSFCAVSLTAAFLKTIMQPDDTRISFACATPTVMGPYYITYNYFVSVVGGTYATVTVIIATIDLARRRKRLKLLHAVATPGIKNYLKRQWFATRIMLCIAILELCCVVCPYFLLILSNGLGITIFASLSSYSLELGCGRSVLNFCTYMIVNDEFRDGFKKAFGTRNNSVAPSIPENNAVIIDTTNV